MSFLHQSAQSFGLPLWTHKGWAMLFPRLAATWIIAGPVSKQWQPFVEANPVYHHHGFAQDDLGLNYFQEGSSCLYKTSMSCKVSITKNLDPKRCSTRNMTSADQMTGASHPSFNPHMFRTQRICNITPKTIECNK